MQLHFTKMHGCGNDYIYLDCRETGLPAEIAVWSQKLSRRHFSIGADGIICICAPVTAGADAMMRIFNAGQPLRKRCDILRHAGGAAVQIDIIVGAALHFGE